MSIYDFSTKTFPHSDRRNQDFQEFYPQGLPSNLSGELRGSVTRRFDFKSLSKTQAYLLKESFIEIRCQIRKGAIGTVGTALSKLPFDHATWGATANNADDIKGMIKPNILGWLSSQHLLLGGTTVEQVSRYAGLLNHAKTLIEADPSYADTKGSQLLLNFVKQKTESGPWSPGQLVSSVATLGPDMLPQSLVQGLAASHDKVVSAMIPLADVFSYIKDLDHVTYGSDIEIRIEFENDDALFSGRNTTAGVAPATPIVSRAADWFLSWVDFGCRLHLKRVTLPEPIVKSLRDKTITDNFQVSQIQSQAYNKSDTEISWQLSLPGSTQITDVVVFGQVVDRTSSQRSHCSSRFDPLGVSRISVNLNGRQVPENAMTCNTLTSKSGADTDASTEVYGEVYRAYQDMVEAHSNSRDDPDHQGLISFEDFRYYPLFCFNTFDSVSQPNDVPTMNQLTINITRNTQASFEDHTSFLNDWREEVNLTTSNFNLFCVTTYNKSISTEVSSGFVSVGSALSK